MALNSLPEYNIRIMKDDLAKAEKEFAESPKLIRMGPPKVEGLGKKVAPPEKLPVAPEPVKAPLPSTEELITRVPLPKAEEAELTKLPQPKPKPVEIKKPKPKFLVILIVVLLILGGIGGFFYWYGKKEEPKPEPEPLITEEPQPSESLIPVYETKIIALLPEASFRDSLAQEIKQETKPDQPMNTFKRIAVLKNEKEFLSLSELFQKLEINYPPYLLAQLGESYNLLLFNQKTGKRLGLIIEVENAENLREQLTIWEETMLEDFKNFYPIDKPGQPASKIFLDDIYRDADDIRYTNLPFSTLTINYTIINNLLIIGTSKETMYTAIDKVLD